MRKIIPIIIIFLFSFSCDPGTGYYPDIDRNIITEAQEIEFEDLIFLVSVMTSESAYYASSTIDSICIYVNDQYWATVNSTEIDTTVIEISQKENFQTNEDEVTYLVVAEQEVENIEFLTAGDYAEYLENVNTLLPGEYVCLIKSFILTHADNSKSKHYPYSYHKFTVRENYKSAFVDQITLNI